jgi:hypothetical protein
VILLATTLLALAAAPAAETLPYHQQLAQRLGELEPGVCGAVREQVRADLDDGRFGDALTVLRAAIEESVDEAEERALSRMLGWLREAAELPGLALAHGADLVGRTHVFRMRSGSELAGTVKGFSGDVFTLELAAGGKLPVPLRALSARGLAQVASAAAPAAGEARAAAHLFLLLGEFETMDAYLAAARRRGGSDERLESAAVVAREIEMLARELPAALAAWQRASRELEAALAAHRAREPGSLATHLLELDRLVRDGDLAVLDAAALERTGIGLAELAGDARFSCTRSHSDDERATVTCPICEGDGIHLGLRPGLGLDGRAIECSRCDGSGQVPCPLCHDRSGHPGLAELQERWEAVLVEGER